MVKINTENIISALFVLGFDNVDSSLFTFVLGKISQDINNEFKFVDSDFSYAFYENTLFDGVSYKLIDGYKLNTSKEKGYNNFINKILFTNDRLIDYISNLDFREIVFRKVEFIGYNNIDRYGYLFSNKEKEIIKELKDYDINNDEDTKKALKRIKEKMNRQLDAYKEIYDREQKDLDLMTSGIDRFKNL